MAENKQQTTNAINVLRLIALLGGIWLLGMLIGNAIAIFVSPNNDYIIESFGDFYSAMGGFEAVGNLILSIILLVVIPLSSAQAKKNENGK